MEVLRDYMGMVMKSVEMDDNPSVTMQVSNVEDNKNENHDTTTTCRSLK